MLKKPITVAAVNELGNMKWLEKQAKSSGFQLAILIDEVDKVLEDPISIEVYTHKNVQHSRLVNKLCSLSCAVVLVGYTAYVDKKTQVGFESIVKHPVAHFIFDTK